MRMPKQVPPGTLPRWEASVTVDDVDAVARKAEENGGRILVPPTDIQDVGRFCTFQDPQGAVLCAITYDRLDHNRVDTNSPEDSLPEQFGISRIDLLVLGVIAQHSMSLRDIRGWDISCLCT